MKHLKSLIGAAALAATILPFQVFAADNPFQVGANLANNVSTSAGINKGNGGLTEILGRIINIALGFLGIVFLVLLIYAGFMWMTAAGDEGKVKKAREMITQAVIGLIVIVAAYAISSFVLTSLVNVTNG